MKKPPQAKQIPDTCADPHVRLDFLWKVHSYTNDYIRFADSKSAVVIGAVTGLTSVLIVSHCFDHLLLNSIATWPLRTWVGLLSLILFIGSLYSALCSVRPRLRDTTPKGFIFWDSVVKHGSDRDYAERCKALLPEQIEENVARHIYALATVSHRKYFYTNLAIWLGVTGTVFVGVVVVLAHIR